MALWRSIRARVGRTFYAHFFRLLVLAVSAAQWAVVAWIARLVAGTGLPGWGHAAGIGAIYLANRAVTASRRRRPGWVLRIYTATAFVSLFCALFLVIAAAVFVVAHGALGVIAAQALAASSQATLGVALDGAYRWVASLGMVGIALTMGYGYAFGQHQLAVNIVPLGVSGNRLGPRPLRIVQISDIHVGTNLSAAQLRAFVDRVNATSPDLICITGDIVDSALADYATFFPILAGLQARYGVCAILGNHDHYAGAERVVAELRRWTPFHVLRDGAVTLDLDGAALHVMGLDDRGRDWARGVHSDGRLAELLASAPRGVPTLLLAHRPDLFPQAAAAGVTLTLSGHTHGGQLALPWAGGRRRNLAAFITRFDRGLYRDGESHLYVNCGLGVTGQRIRLFTPREITVFDLAPA